jgi:acyl-CoA reductase-like NAD-dependent aldehyde dehydrogenase
VDRFAAAAQALVTGDPTDPATQLRPLASEEHYKKVGSYPDGIETDGGTVPYRRTTLSALNCQLPGSYPGQASSVRIAAQSSG